MDAFGGVWENYIEKIETRWRSVVTQEDLVVICGDISWGMSLAESLPDFRYIDALPGKKIILKGNHDYFWETMKKMKLFFQNNDIISIDILHNNFYSYHRTAICGTRGWFYEEEAGRQDELVMLREVGRLEKSLSDAARAGYEDFIACLHYPPVYKNYSCEQILELLGKYGVERCVYGHLHGPSHKMAQTGLFEGVRYINAAADYVDFYPHKLSD